MGKQVEQSTRYESRIVSHARAVGRLSRRYPKTGTKHEADVIIEGQHMRPAVAWERWVGKKSAGRRRAVRMVTITENHFEELLDKDAQELYGYYVQCKSTQAGSLYAWLEGLIGWIAGVIDK